MDCNPYSVYGLEWIIAPVDYSTGMAEVTPVVLPQAQERKCAQRRSGAHLVRTAARIDEQSSRILRGRTHTGQTVCARFTSLRRFAEQYRSKPTTASTSGSSPDSSDAYRCSNACVHEPFRVCARQRERYARFGKWKRVVCMPVYV